MLQLGDGNAQLYLEVTIHLLEMVAVSKEMAVWFAQKFENE